MIIVVVLVFLFCLVRRRRLAAASGSGQPTSVHQPPSYDNQIYSVPVDVTAKLPAYSDLPMNPPEYSSFRSKKGSPYIPTAPPSYSNPDYESIEKVPIPSEKKEEEKK